jgi:hypothetical protein
MVTRCALIEVGRYLLTFDFTLLFLTSRSTDVVVGLTLVLMLVRISQKFELIEDEIRHCAIYQLGPIQEYS